MSFNPVAQKIKEFSRVSTVHFAIVNTPTMRVGKVTLPAGLVSLLGWSTNTNLDVSAGADDDVGWYQLAPSADSNAHHRAKFKVARNGVGRFATKALVPPEVTGPMNKFEPEYKTEGDILFIKVI
jgi:hypothetical protein